MDKNKKHPRLIQMNGLVCKRDVHARNATRPVQRYIYTVQLLWSDPE
jgi:hypothetical protein